MNYELKSQQYYNHLLDRGELNSNNNERYGLYIALKALGLEYIEFSENDILIHRDFGILKIWKRTNEFVVSFCNQFEYLDTVNFTSKLEKPNHIRTLSVAAIEKWIQYYSQLNNLWIEKNNSNRDKINIFLIELENQSWYNNIRWNNEKLRGYVVINCIEYEFTINKKSGYVDQRTTLKLIGGSNIDNFNKLSCNGFTEAIEVEVENFGGF